jgi:hypothetical protein
MILKLKRWNVAPYEASYVANEWRSGDGRYLSERPSPAVVLAVKSFVQTIGKIRAGRRTL